MLFFFFFNDTATTEIYTLSLHDALPICGSTLAWSALEEGIVNKINSYISPKIFGGDAKSPVGGSGVSLPDEDRKSTRLNSSHANISYAVFCLKKKKHISELQSL